MVASEQNPNKNALVFDGFGRAGHKSVFNLSIIDNSIKNIPHLDHGTHACTQKYFDIEYLQLSNIVLLKREE